MPGPRQAAASAAPKRPAPKPPPRRSVRPRRRRKSPASPKRRPPRKPRRERPHRANPRRRHRKLPRKPRPRKPHARRPPAPKELPSDGALRGPRQSPVSRDRSKAPLPSKAELLAFIGTQSGKGGKREIARAFGISGGDRVALKAMLRELADEGQVERRRNKLHQAGTLPSVVLADI